MYYVEEFGPKGSYRQSVRYGTKREAREQMIRQLTEAVSLMEYDDKIEQIGEYAAALWDACHTDRVHMDNHMWSLVDDEVV